MHVRQRGHGLVHGSGIRSADGIRTVLVVDTTGFLNDGWLDVAGHPSTAALHITERVRRPDFGHLEIDFMIDDPGAYTKPWTLPMTFSLMPDTELIEHICENDKDGVFLFGK